MDAHALQVLEFAKVRRLLAGGAASRLGLELIESLEPTADLDRARRWQQETSEVRRLLDEGHDLPLGGLHDVRDECQRAAIGGVLEPRSLQAIADTLRCVERVQRFVGARDDSPALGELTAQLVPLPRLADELERCLGDDGELADHASAELRRARAEIRALTTRLQTTLRRLLGELAGDAAVQDAVVTIREGRYCVPIKASHQGQFQGIIHDRSASGQTVFMEPAVVVRLNNDLRAAQLAEREETARILRELSRLVGEAAGELAHDLRLLAQLDLARARGRLSVTLGGAEPVLDETGRFDLRRARHPLLIGQLGEGVVPLDLTLGDAFTTLLITGPNTGGKTVALKTLGLLTLMAAAGLHLPAEPGSRVSGCCRVFADIGDEQSLEQSLSTFGAHLKQLVATLGEAGPGDLALLDELGAGTDPTEGAALAEAILVELHQRGCRVVATTHHGALKHFAYETEGVENASVEFDAATLAPTFRLLIGVPGASHAFDIAARYGLPGAVLEHARALLPTEHHDAAEIIGRMQASQRRLQAEMESAQHEAALASHRRRELETERQRLRELERELREEARREAARLLAKVQAEADGLLAELRRAEREGPATERVRGRLKALREEAQAPARRPARRETAPRPPDDGPPAIGDTVEVTRLGAPAEVVAIAADGTLEVRAGALRMTVDAAEVTLLKRARPAPVAPRPRVSLTGAIELELHLRGQTVDEALLNLDRFLDQALLAGLPEIRIVHGKGTGTLKRVVQQYLREHPYVTSYAHPPEALGGTGVTVARLER